MSRFLLVCLGGAAGTAARYFVGGVAERTLGATVPYGTLAVNLIGSFLISVIMYLGVDRGLLSIDLRMMLTTGVMGGFTTYSSFNYETLRLFQQGSPLWASAYVGVMLAGCLAAGMLGLVVGRILGS
jgi:CrcB protein